MTHAFFKALLFMAAGIVIHALADEQDIRKMGGLRQLLPRTYWAFADRRRSRSSGIPPFAGFFSKDSILAAAMDHGDVRLRPLGRRAARERSSRGSTRSGCSSSSSGGEPSAFVREHFHPLKRDVVGVSMGAPVAVLAVLSVFGGWIQFSPLVAPARDLARTVAEPVVAPRTWQEWTSIVRIARRSGSPGSASPGSSTARSGSRCRASRSRSASLEHKFYFDELYDALFYRPAVWLATCAAAAGSRSR